MLFFRIAFVIFVAPFLVDTASETSRSINEFSIKMYQALSKSINNNIIYSPFSVSTAFTMLRMGSKKNTQIELDKVFGWNNFDKILEETEKLYEELTERKSNRSFLAIGNKIWVDEDVTLLKTYVEDIYKSYKVKPAKEPFKRNTEIARVKINKWVEQHTGNAIKNLFPTGSIYPETELVLANAIFFNATWQIPFDEADTTIGNFFMSNGGSIKAHYMFAKSYYAIYEDVANEATLLEIPYSGDRFSIIFVRPNKPSGLNQIEQKLSYDILMHWISALKNGKERVEIRIPKFEFQQSIAGVKEMLKNMGLKDIFSPGYADLSGINGKKDLICSVVIHESFIKIDERGTTAVAFVLVIGLRSGREARNFTLDRSFLFYIIDKKNDIVIFSGRVINPSIAKSNVSLTPAQEGERNDAESISMAVMCFSSYITLALPVFLTFFC